MGEIRQKRAMSKADRFRQRWAEAESRVPKFKDALPRSPDVAIARCEALLAFALELNPSLAEGDGDLDEHIRVHDFLMGRQGGGERSQGAGGD